MGQPPEKKPFELKPAVQQPRGMRFTPAQAQILFWSLVALGIGVLSLLKSSVSRENKDDSLPAMSVPEEVYAPYRVAPPPAAETAPMKKGKTGEQVTIELDETEEGDAKRTRPVEPVKKREEPSEYNVELE